MKKKKPKIKQPTFEEVRDARGFGTRVTASQSPDVVYGNLADEEVDTEAVYLVTVSPGIALPKDAETGIPITQCAFYARRCGGWHRDQLLGGLLQVVAFQDGRLLAEPLSVVVADHAVTAISEVPPEWLI